jgi:hypothetical protein
VEDMVIEGLGDIDDVTMEGTERSFGPLAYRIRYEGYIEESGSLVGLRE